MLQTSVAVVRKMLDAVAGSAPSRRRISGMSAPATPLTAQDGGHREPDDERRG